MGSNNNVVIIGAGLGGITAGIHLARQGYNVSIYEKNTFPGGRCGNFFKDGHRFDIGATFLMMPEIYEKTYASFGRIFTEELKLYRMDPVYKVKFKEREEIFFTSDLAILKKQFEGIENGSYNKFLRLMPKGYDAYKKSLRYIIDHNYNSLLDFSLIKYCFLLLKLNALTRHYNFIKRYFKSEVLRTILTFQNLYMGKDPSRASSLFFFIPFMELTSGVFFPRGGMHQVVENFVSIAREHDVKIHLNSPVKEIKVNNGTATGILMEDGSFHEADIIISNADLPWVYNNLLPKNKLAGKLNKLKYTSSAFVFFWGLDTVYPQFEQHNVYVSGRHNENFSTIFTDKSIPDEPTIYVHSPVKSDKSAAPEGQDSIMAIVHTGHIDNRKEQNWETLKTLARQAILKRLAEEGMTDFKSHIKFEVCYTPKTWQSLFNLTNGSAFGSLGHEILQMGYFRPRNQHKTYKNLYFVGGSTHPGSGTPLALISAKLVTERIIKKRMFSM
ncbi:MAG: phytoene desaturase [Bacteroidales bacterium]|nr:MAG: phytoene desaturase [Bacteroidales bacterium]